MQGGDSGEQVNQARGSASQAQQNITVTQAVLTTGRLQALTTLGGQQTAIGVLPAASGAGLQTLNYTLARTVSAQSSVAQPIHVSAASLSNTRLVSPQAINIIQRQLSSGIVGLSTVSAQGLQVLQASGTPLTFVTATSPEAAAAFEQQRKARLLQQQRQKQTSGATTSSSGTIHHLAISSPANLMSNPNQNTSQTASMSGSQQLLAGTALKRSQTAPGAVLIATTLPTSSTSNATTISINAKDLKLFTLAEHTSAPVAASVGSTRPATSPAGGPSPKKIKLEEKPAPNKEIENYRHHVCSYKRQKMREVKRRYREHLTELFYLQGGGNIIEFNTWKKRPTQPLLNFLEGSKLDSDDDEELQEKRINDEVKVLTSAGSNVPLATPVAISTTLPPSVSALSQQAMNSSTTTTSSLTSTPLSSTTPSELQQHLAKASDVKPSIHTLKTGASSGQSVSSKSMKSTSLSPGRSRQQSISSVYENVTGGSQDVIVERAKQEAQILQRVNELRKEGLWSAKRLPRVQEPPRQKAHWDYLLEEMTWLAADFIQERKWKKAAAKKLARMVANHFKEQEQKELRAEKEEAIKLKKIASQMAKMVKEFWTNIEKVVQYKQTTRLEEKKKKALDLHLNFIVDQTEKYSSWLTAGLQNPEGSRTSSEGELSAVDSGDDFQPVGTASDDEETIEREEIESGIDEDATKKEVEELQKESELPLEELLKTLPKEMLDEPSGDLKFDDVSDSEGSLLSKDKDGDFDADEEEEEDVEETIEEQEKHEKKDYSDELDDLKAECELSVEELMKKYAGAYDSDFEMPVESSGDEDNESGDDEESSESEKESGESSEEEEESEEEEKEAEEKDKESKPDEKHEDMGLEFLVKKQSSTTQGDESSTEGPGKEFNDIAAAAQSLQPKGYTLETTEVKTKVPFLLKHTLREYQHVGLDWLATMHDKRLNGILADEMGLGKTIQTIALLAHLACEKGTWGPHLIVVPTSVMLNWEMEFKKWCPAFKILTYYGSIKERKLKRQGWTKTNAFHVCITSYKLVVQDHQAFRRKKWKYFILDEAQNIKNFKSQRWQMLLNFSSQRRLLLTGTPLQNSLMELWSLMHFLMPNVFQSHSEFKEWFSNPLTGMIEGSQEYNESLVRRLHKVLRPFLLRRLKNEVEKQMPQKFEHVVMCRLSKRQRYLYDDFMSQTKTRETLATGHFMSVINILMQLRKVCNHPDLFDPRPIVSPFKMEGIVYDTASLATRVLEYDPLRDVDIYSLYPSLAEMETDLPAFVAQRVKQLKATGKLIQEVDNIPASPPRPPQGQLKNMKGITPAVFQAGGTSSVAVPTTNPQSRPASPLTAVKLSVSSVQSTPTTVNSIKLLLPPSSSSSAQQTILIPNPSGSGPPLILPLSSISSSSSSTSAAIAQAKLISSQLQSGMLQLVPTSSGHQIVTTATTSASASTSSPSSTTSALSSTSSTATISSPPTSSVSLLKLSSVLSQQKPVMRVSPFVVSSSGDAASSSSSQGSTLASSVISATAPAIGTKLSESITSVKPAARKPMKRTELFLESLHRKKEERRQHILAHMAKLNQRRCDTCPVYGADTQECVNCMRCLDASNAPVTASPSGGSGIGFEQWRGSGYVNCLFAQNHQLNHNNPDLFWRESTHLQQLVHSPDEWLKELHGILSRFVFVTPSVISPSVSLRVSHPDLSKRSHMRWLESCLRPEIVEKSHILHPIQSRTMVTFPDLRLIQYDCGKLQTLDLLLRQLKSGQHRVLIFTQMTKMLDVLEAFLNFHGHRYLRLDGTTKVEQRQYLMDRFNADPRIFCFILSTRSGGIGVNLTGADTVIFYDSDWNPTMDAQAQDRCHRIGQTRDVHIYRLVSEMTVEENILKKANQKRLLGDLAIEGGNFTTAFFKEQTISDLFAEPSGLESLVEDKAREEEEKEKARLEKEKEEKEKREKEESKKEAAILSQFEQALCKAEDETDVQAAKLVKAEQKAELAEFDENIPWDEKEAELRKDDDDVSKVELELAMLDKELTPIERYAVTVMEAQMEPETAEELKMAEEDIEASKKDWELARLKALKEEEERRAELEEDEMLYIYSKDESQVKKGRKPLKNKMNRAKAKLSRTSMSGSDLDESFSGRVIGGRRASERNSPQKPPTNQVVRGSRSPEKRNVSVVRVTKSKSPATKAVVNDSKKKIKAAANALQKKAQNGPGRGRGRKPNNPNGTPKVAPQVEGEGQVTAPKGRGRGRPAASDKEVGAKEKKGRGGSAKVKTPPHLQNGHSPALAKLNSKLATQAKNALLKQQAQQAAHITLSPLKCSPAGQSTSQAPVTVVAGLVGSSPARLPTKPTTPKSPPDPNVPPPWSNPNLVIRTRKAAVHSPVVIAQARPFQQQQSQSQPQSVLQQSLNRPPVFSTHQALGATSVASAVSVAKLQGTPDRNIFQLFTPNSSNIVSLGGVTFTPTIRQVVSGTQVMNQIRGATLLNPASLVNSGSLSGARFITTGVAGQTPVVVSAAPKTGAVNVGGSVSNITLLPTVINASGAQTIIPASGTTIVNTGSGARAVLNTARLTSPITLQGIGSLPYAVNLIKTNTGLTLPVRPQQILQTSLAQVAGQPGYVLITPRVRGPTPVTAATVQAVHTPVSLVQGASGQTLQTARVHLLAQVPSGATVIQSPPSQKNVNGVAGHSPAKKDNS